MRILIIAILFSLYACGVDPDKANKALDKVSEGESESEGLDEGETKAVVEETLAQVEASSPPQAAVKRMLSRHQALDLKGNFSDYPVDMDVCVGMPGRRCRIDSIIVEHWSDGFTVIEVKLYSQSHTSVLSYRKEFKESAEFQLFVNDGYGVFTSVDVEAERILYDGKIFLGYDHETGGVYKIWENNHDENDRFTFENYPMQEISID